MLNELDLSKYKTIIFDCDGVILNSNQIKTDAFFDVACLYGKDAAEKLKEYHIDNAGISRHNKFKYLFEEILNKSNSEKEIINIQEKFANKVKRDLLVCEIDQDLNKNEREIAAMDSLAEALENQSNGLENKLAEAEQKIEAAQEKLEQDKAQASWGRYLKIIIAAIALAAIVFVLMRRRKK